MILEFLEQPGIQCSIQIRYILDDKSQEGMHMSVAKRFWKYVDKRGPDECWEWLGCILNTGYGQFHMPKGRIGAHRVSWAIAHRMWPIPKGLQINHTCDNRGCVNPAHLYLGTHSENMQDASVLTPEDVREIRYLREFEGYSYDQLSFKFNVSSRAIRKIYNHETWKEV